MIQILVVEDDPAKKIQLLAFIHQILGEDATVITPVDNAYQAGLHLRRTRFDLLILDISLPLRDGEAADPEGGLKILRAINTRRVYNRPAHIVGLTAYRELADRVAGEFERDMWFVVHYDPSSDEWQQPLGRKLIHIAETSEASPPSYETDLAIITALHQVELEAVLQLPGGWATLPRENDDTIYHHGRFTRGSHGVGVVAAAAIEMGMPAATALAMKMITHFRPRYLALVGIAAGVKGRMGDILVADQSWDYGSGKSSYDEASGVAEFFPAPNPIPIAPALKAKFQLFALDHRVTRQIFADWKGRRRGVAPEVRIGPVASGASVLENRPIIERLLTGNRKLIGVEMETYGVFLAARVSCEPRPYAMSIKSICDHGDTKKSDDHQAYAAYTSARYVHEFALEHLAG
jgi:nucleoside phosphorylase